ncbi:MAG: hypothetical protein HOO06_14710 [Bdellovibrionaceae bacterium]|jgi:hypothetical protein|nr:hypothetical protein [Pseudobdellovibrionaceae bacterium]
MRTKTNYVKLFVITIFLVVSGISSSEEITTKKVAESSIYIELNEDRHNVLSDDTKSIVKTDFKSKEIEEDKEQSSVGGEIDIEWTICDKKVDALKMNSTCSFGDGTGSHKFTHKFMHNYTDKINYDNPLYIEDDKSLQDLSTLIKINVHPYPHQKSFFITLGMVAFRNYHDDSERERSMGENGQYKFELFKNVEQIAQVDQVSSLMSYQMFSPRFKLPKTEDVWMVKVTIRFHKTETVEGGHNE